MRDVDTRIDDGATLTLEHVIGPITLTIDGADVTTIFEWGSPFRVIVATAPSVS